jgi:hypothetical protein
VPQKAQERLSHKKAQKAQNEFTLCLGSCFPFLLFVLSVPFCG